jgi:hypothetical protein
MIALLLIILGAFFLGRSVTKKDKEKEFVVILGGLLLVYFFPGFTMLIIGLILLIVFGFHIPL